MHFSNIEAAREVLIGLLENRSDISALNSGKYRTTRITNIICDLREAGLQIETEMLKAESGKRFGIYRLMQSDANYQRAYELLEAIEARLSHSGKVAEGV